MYKGQILKKATTGSAAYDIATPFEVELKPGPNKVSTGLFLELSSDTYGQLASRSSLAAKGITVEAGVIDSDYRGEIIILLYNHDNMPFVLSSGSRVAQLLVLPLWSGTLSENVGETSETVRGNGVFGSTGN